MVVPASAFWFGPRWQASDNLFSQVNESSMEGQNAAMSLSWHGRYIPANGTDVVSFFVRWGNGSVHAPTFHLTGITTQMLLSDFFTFQCTLDSEDGDDMMVFLVLDDNYSNIRYGSTYGLFPGAHSLSIQLAALEFDPGYHVLSFYAISGPGTFAENSPSVEFMYESASVPFDLFLHTEQSPARSLSSRPSRTASIPAPTESAELSNDLLFGEISPLGVLVAAAGTGLIVLWTLACVACWCCGVHKYKCMIGRVARRNLEVKTTYSYSAEDDPPSA
jgi:hypothetical protein